MNLPPLPVLPEELSLRGVSLRLRKESDDLFLRDVYVSVRWEETAVTGWPDEVRRAFLHDQQALQRHHYDTHYPGAAWAVIEVDGQRAGRFYLMHSGEDLRVVEMSFLPEYRGRGLGGALLTAAHGLARALGCSKVSIHAEESNPARSLYFRLGFKDVEPRPPYILMEWPT